MPELTMPNVAGYCPMGCGQTLFLGEGGGVTCSWIECPNRGAVDEILGDREHEHIVVFGETVFTVRHPLRERLNDELMTCRLHHDIADLAGPPVQPGRYRARGAGDGTWSWERQEEVRGG